jgi:hypothetical protein
MELSLYEYDNYCVQWSSDTLIVYTEYHDIMNMQEVSKVEEVTVMDDSSSRHVVHNCYYRRNFFPLLQSQTAHTLKTM